MIKLKHTSQSKWLVLMSAVWLDWCVRLCKPRASL